MEGSLRETLIGAWRLVDVVKETVDGSPDARPHGDRPTGLILYSPDGFMSAQIMDPDRRPVASADWSALTPEEYADEARGYFAYAGSFEVDEERGTVTHSVEVSLFPGWVGGAQLRVVRARRRPSRAERRRAGGVRRQAGHHTDQLDVARPAP